MLLSMTFSLLQLGKNTEKELFINERDIEKASWDVNNLPAKLTQVF
jgi:hypothetical protein